MAWNDLWLGVRQIAVNDVQVRTTNATRSNAHHDLPTLGRFDGALYEPQRRFDAA